MFKFLSGFACAVGLSRWAANHNRKRAAREEFMRVHNSLFESTDQSFDEIVRDFNK